VAAAGSDPTTVLAGGCSNRGGKGAFDAWALTTMLGSGQKLFKPFEFKIEPISKFDPSKTDLFGLGKFEIKYGFDGLVERNNFNHRNFFRFMMEIEIKI
jgi:hypothetical protein